MHNRYMRAKAARCVLAAFCLDVKNHRIWAWFINFEYKSKAIEMLLRPRQFPEQRAAVSRFTPTQFNRFTGVVRMRAARLNPTQPVYGTFLGRTAIGLIQVVGLLGIILALSAGG